MSQRKGGMRNLGRVVPRKPKEEEPVPGTVLDVLEAVRRTGRTNMVNRNGVIQVAIESDMDPWAIMWLLDNTADYVRALRELGDRNAAQAG